MDHLPSPSEVIADPALALYRFDLEKENAKYETSPSAFITMPKYRLGKNALKLKLEASVFTNGIVSSEFGEGKQKREAFSLGLKCEDTEDLEALRSLSDQLAQQLPDDYSITETIKEDKIYLKLKTDDSKRNFKIKSNIPLNPKKSQDADISRDDIVTVLFELGVYVNLRDKTAGLIIHPLSLVFDKEVIPSPPQKKKQKVVA